MHSGRPFVNERRGWGRIGYVRFGMAEPRMAQIGGSTRMEIRVRLWTPFNPWPGAAGSPEAANSA
ncbi:hypothetical protein [Gemmatimonas sp.]|uniref:hypothetical protein n=1 Tax=Gemmatimonas sp. TaxID=1962908 RepID=UPI003F72266A